MDGTNPQPQADNQPPAQPIQDVAPQSVQPAQSTPEQSVYPSVPTPPQPQMGAAAPMQAAPVAVDPGHGLGIASLVCALLGLSLVGLILGIIAKGKSKAVGKSNGLAMAGIIISALAMVVQLILVVFIVIGAASTVQKCKNLGPGTHYDNGTTITCS